MAIDYAERLHQALEEEHRLFFDYNARTLKSEYAALIDCPVCGSKKYRVRFEKDWFKFCRCRECGMLFLNPRLNEAATYKFYNGKWTYTYNESKFQEKTTELNQDDRNNLQNLESILEVVGARRGSFLEIGPGGRGVVLAGAREKGFSVSAVELGEDNYRSLRIMLGESVYNKDLRDIHFPDGHFDVVYMRDVFEHVLAPRALLEEIYRVLAPEGVVSIEVPNHDGLVYRLVGSRHVCFFGFAHVNYWSPKPLEKVLHATGLTPVRLTHKNSDDVRINTVAQYLFGQSSFTSLKRRKVSRFVRGLMLGIRAVARVFGAVDNRLPAWADRWKMGSVINVVARKVVKKQ